MAADTQFINIAYRTKKMLMVWISLLWISDFPDILFYYLIGPVPSWMIYLKFVLMLLYTGVCLIIKRFKPVLPYSFFILVFISGVMISDWLKNQSWWRIWEPVGDTSLILGFVNIFVMELTLVLLIIAVFWLTKRKPKEIFLSKIKASD
jgi:hypothetical protein